MATIAPWHNKNGAVAYHMRDECVYTREVLGENRAEGPGEHRVCKRCFDYLEAEVNQSRD